MWALFIQQLQSGRTEEKFISTEVLRLLLIISFKSLSALDFKIMLNIVLYIPVVSRNTPRAKEPSKYLKYCVWNKYVVSCI